MFFSKFYPFDKKTKFYKQLFQSVSIISLLILLFFGFKFLMNDSVFDLFWIWIVLRICVVIVIITHLILIIKKVLPIYLGIAFLLSTVFSLIHFNVEPTVNVTLLEAILIENLFYIITVIETLFVTFYIVHEIVKEKLLAINLRQENLKLKLRLLQKNENTQEKTQEILDAFYKDYRYLLNSLYAPKINSENFNENLIEFCDKLNQLTENNIKYQFSIKNIILEQEKCIHLYRIISELTTNAIKHSKATEIKIEIYNEKEDQIVLSVKDNGIGFDKNTINNNSYGFKNIKERVLQIDGSLDIKSTKKTGTSITIKTPKDA